MNETGRGKWFLNQYWLLYAPVLRLCLSIQNAVVLNTLNSVDYERLKLTMTAGKSRIDVEAQPADVNNTLHGYEHASRALAEALFLSYASRDGTDGIHTDSEIITGTIQYFGDLI